MLIELNNCVIRIPEAKQLWKWNALTNREKPLHYVRNPMTGAV